MFYSVDRRGLYQTGGTLDLWKQGPLLGRPVWRLPDWFEADDLRAHVAEGLSLHGWQYMVERSRTFSIASALSGSHLIRCMFAFAGEAASTITAL
jgi:hypothetical protein